MQTENQCSEIVFLDETSNSNNHVDNNGYGNSCSCDDSCHCEDGNYCDRCTCEDE